MNIQPKAGPSLVMTNATATSPTQAAARERAISRLVNTQPTATPTPPSPPTARVTNSQPLPVANANNISPEELSALATSKPNEDEDLAAAEGQNTTTDESTAAPAEAKPQAATEDAKRQLSDHYRVLANKERALRAKAEQQNAAVRAKEEAIAQREAAIKAKEAEYATGYVPKERLTQDPFGVLSEAGLSYEQLTERMLNPPAKLDPSVQAYIKSLEAKINSVAETQAKAAKDQQDQQTSAYQQAIRQIESDTTHLVNSDPAFEMIKETASIKDVVHLIEKTFKRDGILLSVEQACKETEEYLAEEAIRLSKLKKVQERMKVSTAAQATGAPSTTKTPAQPQMTTLSNRTTSSKPLSAKERAIAAFNAKKIA